MSDELTSLRSAAGSERTRRTVFSSENRILLFVILAISLSFLIVAWGIYQNYQSTLERNYERFTEMLTSMVSVGIVERLSTSYGNGGGSGGRINDFVDRMLESSEDIAAIEVYPRNGAPVIGTKNISQSALNESFDIAAPLIGTVDGARVNLGTVHVKFTKKTLLDIRGATSNIIFWVFMSAWFTSILAVSLNTYILSKHLRTFVRGVKRLSTGDFGYKILEHDLWGELRTLAESFNEMSTKLRIYEDQNLETITFERNKLKAILLSIADGVVVCDNHGKITIINEAACQMLGFKTSSWAIDTSMRDYVTEEGEKCFIPVVEAFQKEVAEQHGSLPEGFATTVELPEIALRVILSPIQVSEGDTLGFIMIMHDVTKEYQVDKMKTNFISNVSHELRTPVTTIKSYVDTIYNHGEDLDELTYKEFIETINIETDRLKKLVNDILDFSRLEEGYELEKEYVDVTPVINITVQSVKVLAEQKDIQITTAIESSLPRVCINSDSIERVLRNLLSNAIKYTGEGGRIKVRAEVNEKKNALEIMVQDSGIGVAEEHLPHLFERFYRVENKVHTIKGTGLGLHLVKVAIEKHHGGEVFVESNVGEGSMFGFRLPLDVDKAPDKSPEAGKPADETPRPGKYSSVELLE